MKKTILLIGITMAAVVPTFAQGFIDFSWTAGSGIRIGTQSNPSSQQPGWFVAGDYSVQAFMATGAGVPEASLAPIAAARTTFLGGMTTTATGNPGADGSGLWFAGAQDTGLPRLSTRTSRCRARVRSSQERVGSELRVLTVQ